MTTSPLSDGREGNQEGLGVASASQPPGHSAEPEPVPVSALRASVPNADDYDDMYHALGRPEGRAWRISRSTFRNHYCLPADSEQARRFEALGWWRFGRLINDGRDAVYSVNAAGWDALIAWLDTHPTGASNEG